MFLASFGLSFHFGFGAFDQEGDFRNRWMFSQKCGITEGEMRAIIAVSNLRPNPFFPRNALVISRTRWWIDPALTDTMFFLWIMTQFARQSVGCKPKTAIATAHLGIVYVDHAPASLSGSVNAANLSRNRRSPMNGFQGMIRPAIGSPVSSHGLLQPCIRSRFSVISRRVSAIATDSGMSC